MFNRKKGNIVVSLGDDGAIVTCFESGMLVKRYFLSSPYSSEFTELTNAYPDYPLYLLLDTIDQNYVFSSFPALRSSNLMKMVNRKILNEFDPADINAYMCLGKDETSVRKDVKYVFVSIRNSNPLTDWLEVIKELPNRFMGAYLLPVESEDYIAKLQKTFPSEMGEGANSKWRVLISHNKVGGFRQVVYKEGRIIFTRISQATNIQSPDSIGINISQEAANTLEYIRRIGFNDDSLAVYVVCAKDAFQFIEIPGVEDEDITFLTPFEIAEKLNLKGTALENDKFGDVVFASHFYKSKKKLRVSIDEFKEIDNAIMIQTGISYLLKIILYLMPLAIMYLLYNIYINSTDIAEQEQKIQNLKRQISSIKNFEDQFGVNPDFLMDMVQADKKVTKNDPLFNTLLARFNKANEKRSLVSNVNFKRKDDEFVFSLNVMLDTDDVQDYADLIIKAQNFADIIKGEFAQDYKDIVFTNMPSESNIKFDSYGGKEFKNDNIQIVIKGRVN